MARYINPFPQYINISGSPINGGFLKFFNTGTSTPKNVFSDANLTLSIGSTVRLSASGRVPSLFLSGAYRVTLTDAGNNELDSADLIGVDTDIVNFDEFLNTNTYNIPDVVKGVGSDDLYYQSIVDTNLGNTPSLASAFWEQFFFFPTWNTAQSYTQGRLVIASDGLVYQSQTTTQGNNPISDDGTNWRSLLQKGGILTSAGIIIEKDETASAGLSYVSASNQRWNWFFDTDESIKLNRFNSSGVLQDAVMSFDNTTGALTTIGNFTVNSGDITFSQNGNAAAFQMFLTTDALQNSTIEFQDVGIRRWELGQNSTNNFQLTSYNASGAGDQTIFAVADGTIDLVLPFGNLSFQNASQGFSVLSSSNSTMDFNFTGVSTTTAAFEFFDSTTTTGTRLFNIYKGDGTSTITFQINAEDGSIHPALDRAGETFPGVKLGKITLSTSAPSGAAESGDLWLRF